MPAALCRCAFVFAPLRSGFGRDDYGKHLQRHGDQARPFRRFSVILVGHFVNMNLTIMVGVIHGLRLNFLEWYQYCFKGDGRAFNPLRLRKAK